MTVFLLMAALAQEPASFTLAGDWAVHVNAQTLSVTPPAILTVAAEKHTAIPIFNPKAGGWARGAQLQGVKAQETTSPYLLDTASFTLRAGPEPDSPLFTKGLDYEVDLTWGTFGRLPDSRIQPEEAVYASYRHTQLRLDAVVLSAEGKVVLREGEPRAAAPAVPEVQAGERHLGNIYLSGFLTKLGPEHLFPVLETAYPPVSLPSSPTVERLKRRLNEGQPLRILAWGDSVTDAAYLPSSQRWQEQFRHPSARPLP